MFVIPVLSGALGFALGYHFGHLHSQRSVEVLRSRLRDLIFEYRDWPVVGNDVCEEVDYLCDLLHI